MDIIQNHNYIQIVWKAREEVQEIIITIISDLGFESFEQQENFLYAYIPADMFNEKLLQTSLNEYSIVKDIPYETKYIPAENWNAVWESNFSPVALYPDVLIRATHHDSKDDKKYNHVILIQPKMAFGTGHHETTQMMLKAMTHIGFEHKMVLDVGCGSGILSIYASFLGAKNIASIDIDAWCVENTQENADLNHVKNIKIYLGDINTIIEGMYDVILANINRNIILSEMELYLSKLNPNGFLIVSGFLNTDIPIIQNQARKLNLTQVQEFYIEAWACLVFQKNK